MLSKHNLGKVRVFPLSVIVISVISGKEDENIVWVDFYINGGPEKNHGRFPYLKFLESH